MKPSRESPDNPALRHPKVAKALGMSPLADEAPASGDESLPPLPDPPTPDAMCEWITTVVSNMDPSSPYRQRLALVVKRHEFRKRTAEEGCE